MACRVDRGLSVRVVTCALALTMATAVRAGADDASPTVELVSTVKTSRSRAEMSAFLVKEAEAAFAKRDWPRAIPIYEAIVVARGPASAEARKLADVYALADLRDEALEVLQQFSATTEDPKAKAEADDAIARLEKASEAFSKRVSIPSVDKLANQAFKLGRAAFAKKQYGDALVYYTMGYRMAPDLPGFLRELGATYDKLGATDKKAAFYLAYLRRRPFGKNADDARKALASDKSKLGKLSISSALPCEQVWVNGQEMPGTLPKKDLLVAPGTYKAMCLSYKYEVNVIEGARVVEGKTANLTFNWAIVVNKLENPLGRISLENPPTEERPVDLMMDLGIDQPEIGVPIPADGRALRMVLKDDSGTVSKECFVKFAPGQRIVVTWKQC